MSSIEALVDRTVSKRTVLITGCSDGGLGAGLAKCFHSRGLRVLATARNAQKMSSLAELGIEVFTLDVLDESSIASCVQTISEATHGSLDLLINNAGGGYFAPIADVHIGAAKDLFDLNVWSQITVTQAFLPLLIKAGREKGKAMIVNHTSISSVMPTPHSAVYQASKAAAAMFNDHMRLEFEPFGIHVVDLKTGCVHSGFHANRLASSGGKPVLREGSIYSLIKPETEAAMGYSTDRTDLDEWSKQVVDELLRDHPRAQIWKGKGVWGAWWQWAIQGWAPTWFDQYWRRTTGLELLKSRLKEAQDGNT